MELGNAVFGCSRGDFEIPDREAWEKELFRLFDVIDQTTTVTSWSLRMILLSLRHTTGETAPATMITESMNGLLIIATSTDVIIMIIKKLKIIFCPYQTETGI